MTHVEQESAPRTPSAIADPAPLGLAAFALTTFLLSAKNASWTNGTDAWLGYALAYGGIVQILAGMWEFRHRNVFGATFFSSYGAFWLGLGLYAVLIAGGATPAQEANDLGWILLAFAIFNTYMMLWASQINQALLAVLVALEATEIILFIGNFATSETTVKIGGYLGVLTAICAWYASAAGLINGMTGHTFLGVGKPLKALTARSGSSPR
ncbi:acetate uptake transporter [Spirillospora sp. CA-108201]